MIASVVRVIEDYAATVVITESGLVEQIHIISSDTSQLTERDFIIWREVQIKFLGRTIVGSYALSQDGLVTVKTPTGEKTTQLGGSPAEFIAKRLLRELAVEGKA
jgi:hypothetical protein